MVSHRRNSSFQPPLAARNGRKLKILAICRISTLNQDERSLADQEAFYREWLERHTELPFDMEVVASQGSGECLDRAEYLRAIELVESREFDLVIAEDLGRICRRVHAHIFCETCEDHETRLIAVNDHVDTGREDWRLGSFFAVMRHEAYNRDTSQRIRRSLRNRFCEGGVVQTTIFGYVKPEGTSTDDALHKDAAAEPIYDEWFRRLEDGASFAEVADWLNEQGILLGPYARSKRWSGTMVGRITCNPILKGVRVRNRKMSRRVNSTGRRRSVNAPQEEVLERDCPHLAFIEPRRFDRVVRMLNDRNDMYRRGRKTGIDPRKNVPKKRTRWPGQHLFCGICGRMLRYGGHGQNEHLLCGGAYEYLCWNGVTTDGRLAAGKMSEKIFAVIEEELPDFDNALIGAVERQVKELAATHHKRRASLQRELQLLDRKIQNLAESIERGPWSNSLRERLEVRESEKRIAVEELERLETESNTIELPTMDMIRELARDELSKAAPDSIEFGRVMRRLIPRIDVYPYIPFDGGAPVLRAQFTITLTALVPRAGTLPELETALSRRLVVDLFDPPQRIRFRSRVVELRRSGMKQRDVAAALGVTQPAVQAAERLEKKMQQEGIDDPYVPLKQPPQSGSKLSRHKHRRYRFEPLDDHCCQWPS